MIQRDAIALIDHPDLRTATPAHWADLGCGSGTFTLALAALLPPGSTIEAIDLHPSITPQTTPNGVTIKPRAADFTTLEFSYSGQTSSGHRNPDSIPIPDRLWPGTAPLSYHGILMANSLHYVRDQRKFLSNLKTNTLILIEYDIDTPVARWVPYPLSFTTATNLLQSTHWPNVQKLGAHPSAFGRSELYALLAEHKAVTPANFHT
jgi:hypothetical protein